MSLHVAALMPISCFSHDHFNRMRKCVCFGFLGALPEALHMQLLLLSYVIHEAVCRSCQRHLTQSGCSQTIPHVCLELQIETNSDPM